MTDATEATFKSVVLDRSHTVPVVVDFWAAWCAPCRALTPILEKLAAEANGAWELVKVDTDANPRLAAAARVQGIPAVRAFKNGRQVAEFTGALPEPQVRAWLAQLGPSPADVLAERAQRAQLAGDLADAERDYEAALREDPAHEGAARGVARVRLAQRAATTDEASLRQRVAADPADVEAAVALADVLVARGEVEEGLMSLVEVVRRTSGDERDRARRHLLELMQTLPPDDPRVASARRALTSALF